ncbi:MAG: UvrD-helicase domain-containing protein, partial [Solirubrobacteraceae bacterium]
MSAADRPAPAFDLSGELPTGVTVLEASAGTGKTFTIAALDTRFVASGLPLEQLLVITFTRVATSELRERVRERLVRTEQGLSAHLSQTGHHADDQLTALLAKGARQQVQERLDRLATAIANFDAATIETTHGFCRLALEELGTLANSDPVLEFVDNVDALVDDVVDDLYLRRFFRPSDAPAMSRTQAGRIADIAVRNPRAQVHPPAAQATGAQALHARLAAAVRTELETRKRTLGLMTPDDQLMRLYDTLQGQTGAAAVALLQNRYRVVLIDEFQDTDPLQWRIVERIFGAGKTTLVLIGDPKQAIYAFRGADVYAYLDAARSAHRRATLAVNQRSDQPLLEGLHALFGNAHLGSQEIVYRRVQAATAHRQTGLQGAPGQRALRFRVLDVGEHSVERTTKGFPYTPATREFVYRDLASQIVETLSCSATVRDRGPDGRELATVPLAPGHIAVLVRTNQQARKVQQDLQALGMPAVVGGSGSVFQTAAATDWLSLLAALEAPSHPARARSAALTPLIGWDAARLANASETDLEQLHRMLHGWSKMLREHGISALGQAVFSGGQLAARLLRFLGGERQLTDLQHVAELLGGASDGGQLGVAALSAWLREHITSAERDTSTNERTRRLDSDADAVQIATIHRSKGLEFPVVFCPFLWEAGRLADDGDPVDFHDDRGQRAIDVALSGSSYRDHLSRHNREVRDEELRLAYVALTRARHQTVLWWASTWAARDSPLGRLLFAKAPDGSVAWQPTARPREAEAWERLTKLA